ncbi:MAG: STAS/SEC14 domain-containing protein [Chloroflexota bacterium]
MSVSTLELRPSPQEFIQAAERLPTNDLMRVLEGLLTLRAKRYVPTVSKEESELLEKINVGLSPEVQLYYHQLIEKRLDETMNETEHQEFISLNQQIEAMNVERISNLIKLAAIRQVSVPQLMKDLGIESPGYVS